MHIYISTLTKQACPYLTFVSYHRKRRGGIKLEGSDSGNKHGAGSGSESGGSTGIPEGDKEETEVDPCETKKSRVDDLWASFKKDMGGPISSFSSGSLTSPGGNTESTGVNGSPGGSVSRGGGGGGSTKSTSKGKVHFSLPTPSVVLHQQIL